MQYLVTLGPRNKRTWKQHPEGLVIWQSRGGAQGSLVHRWSAGEPGWKWWNPARPGQALGPGWVQLHQGVGQRQLRQGLWHTRAELSVSSKIKWLTFQPGLVMFSFLVEWKWPEAKQTGTRVLLLTGCRNSRVVIPALWDSVFLIFQIGTGTQWESEQESTLSSLNCFMCAWPPIINNSPESFLPFRDLSEILFFFNSLQKFWKLILASLPWVNLRLKGNLRVYYFVN